MDEWVDNVFLISTFNPNCAIGDKADLFALVGLTPI